MARSGRPKKIAPTATAIPATDGASTTPATDNILEQAKGRFEVAVVIGLLPDGNIDIVTNNSNYAILQWLFNRASYELLVHEKIPLINKGEGA